MTELKIKRLKRFRVATIVYNIIAIPVLVLFTAILALHIQSPVLSYFNLDLNQILAFKFMSLIGIVGVFAVYYNFFNIRITDVNNMLKNEIRNLEVERVMTDSPLDIEKSIV